MSRRPHIEERLPAVDLFSVCWRLASDSLLYGQSLALAHAPRRAEMGPYPQRRTNFSIRLGDHKTAAVTMRDAPGVFRARNRTGNRPASLRYGFGFGKFASPVR